jgi:hypothetical protein
MNELVILIDNDRKVTYGNKPKYWKHKFWKDCTEKEKQKVNLRWSKKSEGVIDDDKGRWKEILQELDRDGLDKRIVKKTGRGAQISLFFYNLEDLDIKERNEVRKLIIEKYGGDISKANEETMVVIENRPHHKNPNLICEIIERNEGYNKIPEEMIKKAREIIEIRDNNKELSRELQKNVDFEGYWTKDGFFLELDSIDWSKMPMECEFNNVPAKNFAIAAAKTGSSKKEVDKNMKPFIAKIKGYNYREFEGWYNKAVKGEFDVYNIVEINKWSEKYLKKTFYQTTIKIPLPREGRLVSKFVSDISKILKDKDLFYRVDAKEIVEIGKLKAYKTKEIFYTGFISVKPHRLITSIEKYITPVNLTWVQKLKKEIAIEKSITSELANTILNSYILQQSLPQISRIFTIPIPILHNNELVFPKKGYDERFNSWLPYDSPEITKLDMELEEAKNILKNIFNEFCFKNKQDYINAIAGLLTPYLRGLFKSFNTRTPVFFYLGNRERVGKDYCAGITGIVYEGWALEEPPVSTSERMETSSNEELRKKMLAAMINGRKRLHFSNNKGYVNNAVFEGIITAEKYSDRILGRNELLTFDNELDFSLSGNVGIGFTPDLANRCRFINLFLDIEDANSREFEKPNLHQWVKENRGLILSALFSLVKNWVDKKCPKGTIPFASFPEWAEICGGIMEAAGYDNPCKPDKEVIGLVDSETADMKKLFELCYKKYPETWIKKTEIKAIIENQQDNENEIFSYLDFNDRGDATKFGRKLSKNIGRIYSDIRLILKDIKSQSAYQEFMFTRGKQEKKDNVFN